MREKIVSKLTLVGLCVSLMGLGSVPALAQGKVLEAIFTADPIKIDEVLRKIGTHVNTHVPGPRWADYVAMVDGAVNAPLHPFYSESVKRMKMKQGLPFVEGAPVGIDGTYRWILSLAEPLKLDPAIVARVATEERDRVAAAISGHRLDGLNVMVAGYEGHEFLLVRLLIEAGAKVPFLSTAVSTNPLAREEEGAPWLARTLDWPFPGLGRLADVVRSEASAGEYFSVTWPGYAGALTAMAPGRFGAHATSLAARL